MRVSCDSCGTKFKIDDSRIPPQGLAMKCPKCQAQLTIRLEGEAAPAETPPEMPPLPPAAPLPSAPKAAPAAPPPLPTPADEVAPPDFDGDFAGFDPNEGLPEVPPPESKSADPFANMNLDGALADLDDDLRVDGAALAPELPARPPAQAAKPAAKADEFSAMIFDEPLEGELRKPRLDDLPAPKAAKPSANPLSDDMALDLNGLFDSPAPTAPKPQAQEPSAQGFSFDDMLDFGSKPAAPGMPAPATPDSSGGMKYGELDLGVSDDDLGLPSLGAPPLTDKNDMMALGGVPSLADLPDLGSGDRVLTFLVRRKGGKAFGPFPTATIVDMIASRKLNGDEEVSPSGGDWVPMRSVEAFDHALNALGPLPTVTPSSAPAPVTVENERKRVAEESLKRRRTGQLGVFSPMRARRFYVRPQVAIPIIACLVVGLALAYLYFVEELSPLDLVMSTNVSDKPLYEQLKSRHKKIVDEIQANIDRDSYKSMLEARDAALEMLKTPDFRGAGAVWALLGQIDYTLLWRFGVSKDMASEAQGALDRLAQLKHDDPEISFARAHGLIYEKKYGQARELLQKLLMSDQKNVKALHLLAETLLFLPDKGNAENLLEQVESGGKATAHTYYLQGRLLDALGQTPKAKAAYAKALKADPDHLDSQIERTGILLKEEGEGNAKKAEDELARIRNAFKDRMAKKQLARIHYYTALIAQKNNEPYKVVKELASAIDNEPDYFLYNRTLGDYFAEKHEYEKAQEQYSKCVENNSEDLRCRLQTARMLLILNHPDQALFKLEEAAKLEPKNAEVVFLTGMAYEGLFQVPKALDAYERAIQLDPNGVEYYTSAAALYMKQDNLTKAGEYVQKARLIDANSPKVHIFLGQMYLHQNDKEKAIGAFTDAIKADPKEKTAHLALGNLLRETGKPEEALREYQQVLALDDKSDQAYYGQGRVYYETKDYDRSVTEFEKALALNSRSYEYYHFAGVAYYAKGEAEKAKNAFLAGLQLKPGYAESSYYLGRLFMDEKTYDKAQERFEAALSAEPKNPVYLLYSGWLLEHQEKYSDALDFYERALNEKKDYAEAYLRMGVTLRAQNKFKEAIGMFVQAQKQDPSIMSARIELGDCYFEMRSYKQSVQQYQEAIKMNPKAAEAYRKLGFALNELSQPAAAITQLRKAAELDRQDAGPHLGLGYAYKALKRNKEAIAEFEQYLDLNPSAIDRKEVEDEIYWLKNR